MHHKNLEAVAKVTENFKRVQQAIRAVHSTRAEHAYATIENGATSLGIVFERQIIKDALKAQYQEHHAKLIDLGVTGMLDHAAFIERGGNH